MTAAAAETMSPVHLWLARGRFVLATAVLWAGLHFLVGWALPHDLDRPLVLSSSPYGPLAGLLLIAVIWVGGGLASLLVRPHGQWQALFIVGLALALWAAEGGRRGGTMDEWLIQRNPAVGPPASAPYWRLLPDYVYLLVAVAGAAVASARLGARGDQAPWRVQLRRTLALDMPGEQRRSGVAALLAAAVVAGVAALILMGPAVAATYRGQVYFAVGIGLFAGVFVAQRLVKTRGLLWAWLAPFLLGTVGLVLAALRPQFMLPPPYQHLNTIPAWGLARALPVEMVGIGLVGALWMLRSGSAETTREPGG
jgi:hypothetical protein